MTCHDRLVRSTAAAFSMRGLEVRADLAGWERPKIIRHFVPDVTAFSHGRPLRRRIIAEIEEEHSLFVSHSVWQVQQMAKIASSSAFVCYLVVPRAAVPLAKLLLGQVGARGLVRLAWTTPWRGGSCA